MSVLTLKGEPANNSLNNQRITEFQLLMLLRVSQLQISPKSTLSSLAQTVDNVHRTQVFRTLLHDQTRRDSFEREQINGMKMGFLSFVFGDLSRTCLSCPLPLPCIECHLPVFISASCLNLMLLMRVKTPSLLNLLLWHGKVSFGQLKKVAKMPAHLSSKQN